LTAIIVSDVQKAMSLLGAAFYGFPQNQLFITGITGTKGKTTTAYFAHGVQDAILMATLPCFRRSTGSPAPSLNNVSNQT
jgi:UDP-N-acetylmuramyl tripeptide synthase